jgi:hypothetical protein
MLARRYCPASTDVSSSLKAAERGSRRMMAAPYFQRVMAHSAVPAQPCTTVSKGTQAGCG